MIFLTRAQSPAVLVQMVPVGMVPADFQQALDDCKGSPNCMALGAKPVRGTSSERMPLYRLNPPAAKR